MTALLRTGNAFLAVLFVGLFAMAARNVTDPDVWWHLKTGQYIAEHTSVPRTDPFSYTRAGQPWVAHEWLTELLLYQIQRIAGWGGLIVIFAAVVATAFFFLYLRCGPAPYVAGMATLYAALATAPVWGVRPQVLSLLLTSLWLLILERSESNSKLLWWTLPLTLLWVNLHAGFALGLALSALFVAGDWIERVFRSSSRPDVRHFRTSALMLFLNLLLVPLNPNGLRLFWYPVETLRSTTMQKYIDEWASPNFHHAEYWPFLLLLVGSLAALRYSRHQVRVRDLLLLLVTLPAGLSSMRLVPLFALIAVPFVSKRLGNWPKSSSQQRGPRAAALGLLNGTIVLAMVGFAGIHTTRVLQRQPQAEQGHFPARAADFLQAHPPASPLFNSYNWGGYLIWRLYPSPHVFIDGRADLYEKQLLDQFADTYQFQGDWERTFRHWAIGTVLVPTGSALATGLRNCRGWSVSYEDPQSIVFTRTAPPHGEELTPGIHPPNPGGDALQESLNGGYLGMQEITPNRASCRLL